jgi:transcriptional regulator with XRE-family HTH domain
MWEEKVMNAKNISVQEAIGKEVLKVRLGSGLSQREFGRRIGLSMSSPSLVSEIENGRRNPSRRVLIAIQREFGVDILPLYLGAATANKFSDTIKENERLKEEIKPIREKLKEKDEEIKQQQEVFEAQIQKADKEIERLEEEIKLLGKIIALLKEKFKQGE